MRGSYVAEVRLRIRVPESAAQDAGVLRVAAEQQFLRGVLDALEAAIHDRLGPRAIVRIRRLPLRWRLTRDGLDDRALHHRLGRELADALVEEALPQGVPSSFVALPRTARAMPRPQLDASIVVFCDEAHALAVALADHTEDHPTAFHHPLATPQELWRAVHEAGDDTIESVLELLAAYGVARQAVAVAPEEIRAWIAAHARRSDAPATARGIAELREDAPRTMAVMPVTPAVLDPVDAVGGSELPRVQPAAAMTESSCSAAEQSSDRTHGDHDEPEVRSEAHTPTLLDDLVIPMGIATQLGGAFYLLSRVAELELAEHLWCAGVPEGLAIAHALARLAPVEHRHDPALAVIAGIFDDELPALPEIPRWAADEVIDKTRHAVGTWLARRGVGREPAVLATQLAALSASLGRDGGDPNEPVLGLLAASLAMLVCERLAQPWTTLPARALTCRRGVVIVEPETIRVELVAGGIEVELRRAGLDFDPGWVPWLGRTVRIVHETDSL